MKNYEIEVMERYSHGCYGKQVYFGLVLNAENCKAAESFAEDVIYNMTYGEFFEMCINDNYRKEIVQNSFMDGWEWITNEEGKQISKHYHRSLTDKIKDDHKFTFRARVFKG